MDTPQTDTKTRPRIIARLVSVTAFMFSSLTLAIVGSGAVTAAMPFLKSAILGRNLENIRTAGPEQNPNLILKLNHLATLTAPYRDRMLECQRLLTSIHAGQQDHDNAAAAAARAHELLSTPLAPAPSTATLQWTRIPEAWANHFYNQLTAARLPADPWIAYRELIQLYQNMGDRDGARRLRSLLETSSEKSAERRPLPRPTAEPETKKTEATPENRAASPVQASKNDSNLTPAREEAQRKLIELQKTLSQLQTEWQAANEARRREIGDRIRSMRYEEFRLRQAAAGIVESLDLPESDNANKRP